MLRSSESEHPSSEELHAFLSGQLAFGRAEELETHINLCAVCSHFLEDQSELLEGESLLGWTENGQLRFDNPAGRLDSLDITNASATIAQNAQQFEPGNEFGDYRLDSLIGEGGNGVVYRATQQKPVQRTVAIKFAKPTATGFGSPHRFMLEHQTLAGLNHSSIPHVYDAGLTKNGVAYFVMEYIEGHQLTEYLRDHQLPLTDCLELIKLLCEVVQYAHRNGVVHRDLKPSNILLERNQETGLPDTRRPRVIDFGIAKTLRGDGPSVTGTHEMVGTLEYMSPEQLGSEPRCDTRSDVYALGLIFYELLAFRLPFLGTELRELPLDAAIHRVRCDDPVYPSKTLSLSSNLQTDRAITTRIRRLQGELDWIVMKAIDRDPDRRYQSAALLSDDIDRHIRGDLISAASPSLRRKTGKWIRKHRGWFAAGVVFSSLLICAGTIILGLLDATLKANRDLALRTYIGEIQIAEERLDRGHTAEAIEILRKQRDDPTLAKLRGLEARLLWKETHPEALLDQAAVFHDRVDDFAVSSQSQIAALSRKYQKIEFFELDAAKLRPIRTLDSNDLQQAAPEIALHWEKHASKSDQQQVDHMTWGRNPQPLISCVAYTPDGATLAIGTCSGMVLLWDVKNQQLSRFLDCESDLIYRVAISDDQRWLVTVGTSVRLFDLNERSPGAKPKFLYRSTKTFRADFSSDGQYLVVADHDKNLLIWKTETDGPSLPEPEKVPVSDRSTISDVRFSPDGTHVVYGLSNSGIYRRAWDGDDLGEASLLGESKNAVKAIRFADGALLGSTCDGGLLQYWDLTNLQEPQKVIDLAGHSGSVSGLAYHAQHDRFVTSGQDGFLRLYDARPRRQLFKPSTTITCLDVSHDAKRMVLGYQSGAIELRRTDSAEIEKTLHGGNASVLALFYSTYRNEVVAISADERLRIWDIETDKCNTIKVPAVPKSILGDLPDGQFIVAFRDSTIGLFESSGRTKQSWRVNDKGFAGAGFYYQMNQIVTCENNWLRFWDLDGNAVRKVPVDQDVRTVVAHPTEDVLIGYGVIGRIAAINPATGEIVREYRGHVGVVERVIVLEGGKRLLSLGSDFTARFWDYDSGMEVLMQDGGTRRFRRIATNHQQDILITVFSDNSVKLATLDED